MKSVRIDSENSREQPKRNREYSDAQRNLLLSKGAPALRIGLRWVTCPIAQRGRYLRALGWAFRHLHAAGVALPSEAQVERDIEAVMVRSRKDGGR